MEMYGHHIGGDLWVLECSVCGPLGLCAADITDDTALDHLRAHNVPIGTPHGR